MRRPSPQEYRFFYRRNLPHFQPPGSPLFVTFRLAGSLPAAVWREWLLEKRRLGKQAGLPTEADLTEDSLRRWKRRWFARLEKCLDAAIYGPTFLKHSQVADQVAESLHYRDGQVYQLDAYCIMPNHVHMVFTPLVSQTPGQPYPLAKVLQSLKGYTAWKANRLLARRGAFWAKESYDHAVRDENEWERIILYILHNPVKAGLVADSRQWPWTYCRFPW